jgi:hypothetical protein
MSDDLENEDNKAAWIHAPYTKKMVKAIEERLATEKKTLLEQALTSSDAKVAATAGRIHAFHGVLSMFKENK